MLQSIASCHPIWSRLGRNGKLNGDSREVDDAMAWAAVDPVLQWADHHWAEVYEAIKNASRHGLRQWKLRMVDYLQAGTTKPFSRWLKGSFQHALYPRRSAAGHSPSQDWGGASKLVETGVLP